MSRYKDLTALVSGMERSTGVTTDTLEVNMLLDIAKSLAVIADTLIEMAKHDDRLADDGR